MSLKLSHAQRGPAAVLALRLPPEVIVALTAVTAAEQARLSVRARLSRSAVARALLTEALHARGALGEGGTPPAPRRGLAAPERAPTKHARGALGHGTPPPAPRRVPTPPPPAAVPRGTATPRPAPPAKRRPRASTRSRGGPSVPKRS
jgi:type II secretory pathway pseudopilin PulG